MQWHNGLDNGLDKATVYLVRTLDPQDEYYEKANEQRLKQLNPKKYFDLCWWFDEGKKNNALTLGIHKKWSSIPIKFKPWFRKFACNPNSEKYDPEFQTRLRILKAPKSMCGDVMDPSSRKKVLLSLALKNPNKIPFTLAQNTINTKKQPTFPDGEGHMGVALKRYLGHGGQEKDIDKEFGAKLKSIAPEWIKQVQHYIDNDSFLARKTKEAVEYFQHMKKLAEERPRVGGAGDPGYSDKAMDFKWGNRMKQIKAKTPHLYEELRTLAPQFVEDKKTKKFIFSHKNTAKKLDCLDWASDKSNELTWGGFGQSRELNDLISSSIRVYCDIDKPKNGFDKLFYEAIKSIRPKWFNKEGRLIKPPSYDEINKSKMLEYSKTNDYDACQKISCHFSTMFYRYFRNDETFKRQLKKFNPIWYIALEEGRTVHRAVKFQKRFESLFEHIKSGKKIPNKRNCNITASWRQMKQPYLREKSKMYAYGFNLLKKYIKENNNEKTYRL